MPDNLVPARIRLEENASPIEGYTLIRHIKDGSFGQVWEARGPGDVPCAMKFVRLDIDDVASGKCTARSAPKSN